MNRFLRKASVLFAVVLTLFSLQLSVFADSTVNPTYQYAAEDLKTLGLFGGTDKGFELERKPTRLEASVMLIRLLGKEQTALSTQLEHPFSDVPAWAQNYIGYMYQNKLTNGVGGNKFGSDMLCDSKMYATFLLRALGYDDTAGDFAYNEALSATTKLYVLSENAILFAKDSFTRGSMAYFSSEALCAQLKDGSKMLIEKLSQEGALSADGASKLLDAYRVNGIIRSCQAKTSTSKSINSSIDVKMDVSAKSASASINMSVATILQLSVNNYDDGRVEALGQQSVSSDLADEATTKYYIVGDKMYMEIGDEKYLTAAGDAANVNLFNSMLPISSPQITKVGSDTEIGFKLDAHRLLSLSFDSESVLSSIKDLPLTNILSSDVEYVISADGKMKAAKVLMTIDYAESGTSATYSIDITATYDYPTDYIPITMPDFSDFVEMTEIQQT